MQLTSPVCFQKGEKDQGLILDSLVDNMKNVSLYQKTNAEFGFKCLAGQQFDQMLT